MKNIIFVEDDDNKIREIVSFFREKFSDINLEIRKSYQTGLSRILETSFDLILLDMSMHNFDKTTNESGGEFMQFAGEDIIKEMIWNDILTKTIIVTQYDIIGNRTLKELKEYWSEEFKEVYLGTVFYSVKESNWKIDLSNFIKENL